MGAARTITALGIMFLALLGASAPCLAAVSSEQAVSLLGQQRTANGIPDLVADPNLALGCQQHNRYMQAEGFGHNENPSSPYYTPEGAGQAPYGGSEVLAWGDNSYSDGWNPWEWAPIHLYLLLHPDRTTAGYDASHGYACMRASGDRTEGRFDTTPQFFSYPGPGSVGIYPNEQAAEWPYTPQQLVGIPENEFTGTNILLFSLGTRGLSTESFSLRSPTGPVAARMVDEHTSNDIGNGSWFAGGGVIVPEKPLAKHTTYTVSVKWRNLAYGSSWLEFPDEPLPQVEFFTQQFSFTTGATSRRGEKPPRKSPTLRFKRGGRSGGRSKLILLADRTLRGQRANVVVRRYERGCGHLFASRRGQCGWRQLGQPSERTLRLRGSQILVVPNLRPRQKTKIEVRTRAFAVGETRYTSAHAELTIRR